MNNIYDTAYMVPYILNQYLNKNSNVIFLTTFDEIYGGEYINNELFYGGSGIINRQGIKSLLTMLIIFYLNWAMR